MGYLTDPTGFHGKPFKIIINHQGKICVLLYLASVVWYCLLSHEQINSGKLYNCSIHAYLPKNKSVIVNTCYYNSCLKQLIDFYMLLKI